MGRGSEERDRLYRHAVGVGDAPVEEEVKLVRRRDDFGDFEYRTDDGYVVGRVEGRHRWMVTGPGILTSELARNLDRARAVVAAARRGDLRRI